MNELMNGLKEMQTDKQTHFSLIHYNTSHWVKLVNTVSYRLCINSFPVSVVNIVWLWKSQWSALFLNYSCRTWNSTRWAERTITKVCDLRASFRTSQAFFISSGKRPVCFWCNWMKTVLWIKTCSAHGE